MKKLKSASFLNAAAMFLMQIAVCRTILVESSRAGYADASNPREFWTRFRIDVRVRNEVVAIDPARKTVSICKLETGEIYEESYDKLILSPGLKR